MNTEVCSTFDGVFEKCVKCPLMSLIMLLSFGKTPVSKFRLFIRYRILKNSHRMLTLKYLLFENPLIFFLYIYLTIRNITSCIQFSLTCFLGRVSHRVSMYCVVCMLYVFPSSCILFQRLIPSTSLPPSAPARSPYTPKLTFHSD